LEFFNEILLDHVFGIRARIIFKILFMYFFVENFDLRNIIYNHSKK